MPVMPVTIIVKLIIEFGMIVTFFTKKIPNNMNVDVIVDIKYLLDIKFKKL